MLRIALLFLLPVILYAQLAVEHVTVIDPRTRTVKTNATVLIEGSVIREVGEAGLIRVPEKYRRIDGRSRYLIPGLWDAHVHLSKAGENTLPLFVANGVTSVRDMGSDPDEVLRWRREIDAGKRTGPRIKTAGRILESKSNVERMLREGTVEPVARIRQPLAAPEDARNAVAALKALGVDHLKVRSIPNDDTFRALAEAAREAALPLTGHPIAPPRQLFPRMRSVEHLLAYAPLDIGKSERRQLFREMRDSGTWIASSLVNFEGSILVPYATALRVLEDYRGRQDSRRKFVSKALLADWREQVEERKDAAEYLDMARRLLPMLYRDFREMSEEGVGILAGTDVGVALIYAGFALHEELAILVDHVGLPPMEALRIATHNPAAFYGLDTELGGVAAGQIADLVLLDRNPLIDIRSTSAIRAVILRGTLFDFDGLQRLLRSAAAWVR